MYLSPCYSGAKYSLLAYTTLGLPEAEGSFQSHSLIVLQDGKTQVDFISKVTKEIYMFCSQLNQQHSNNQIFYPSWVNTQNETK